MNMALACPSIARKWPPNLSRRNLSLDTNLEHKMLLKLLQERDFCVAPEPRPIVFPRMPLYLSVSVSSKPTCGSPQLQSTGAERRRGYWEQDTLPYHPLFTPPASNLRL